ncbi:MAG: hypothetical protein SGILL_001992 [Bacillariaceae sp.]
MREHKKPGSSASGSEGKKDEPDVEEGTKTNPASSTSLSLSKSKFSSSRVPEIWKRFFHQMERIDQLEKKVEEHVSRKRRRIQNLLDQMPSHRRSNARVFVTHQFEPYSGIWTVVVEGKLLIGNLDHVSAARVDKEGVLSSRDKDGKSNSNDSDEKLADKTSTTSSSMAPTATATNTPDRNQYKIGAEEENPVEPILFSHLFDKLEVSFRTIYQPRTSSSSSTFTSAAYAPPGSLQSSSSNKKSRSAKRKTPQPEPAAEVDPSDLRASPPTKLVWNKHSSNAMAAASSSTSSSSPDADANAFHVQYNNHFSERPPPPGMKFHSIVADIKLYPTRPQVQQNGGCDADAEPLYQIINDTFRDTLFGGKYGPVSKPKKADEDGVGDNADNVAASATAAFPSSVQPSAPGGMDSSDYAIPVENDIQTPLFLSYNEIIMAIFQYIQDHNLLDPADKSLIVCDKLLTDILGVESVNFGYIKPLLLEKRLIQNSGSPVSSRNLAVQYSGNAAKQEPPQPVHPVCLTYVMNEKSTSIQIPTGFQEEEEPATTSSSGRRAGAGTVANTQNDPLHSPTVLSFDLDVAVPSLFNYRARELLLNVKKREFEYTTCRTKARYLLVASKGNEDIVKTRIEQAISGQGYSPENIPVFLALVRAAHPFSEARSAAQIDAQTCDLLQRVEETSERAVAAWEAVDALKSMTKVDNDQGDK